MLQALNTGHRGATTLHANSLQQVPERLISIASQHGLGAKSLARLTVSAFDYVIFVSVLSGRRKISGIGKFTVRDGQLQVDSLVALRKLALA
jgi:pilus assembly protein CpaF